LVSLLKFLEDPYYVYAHGYFIRPIYHVLLAGVVLRFFKTEKESLVMGLV